MKALSFILVFASLASAQDPATVPVTPPGIVKIADNMKVLYKANHPWALLAVDVAKKTGTTAQWYADGGQWCACAYVMTGDASYAAKCYAKLMGYLGKDPNNANDVRDYFAERAMMFALIRPTLTPDQDAATVKALNRWAEWCCAVNTAPYVGGWRYGDSDQTTGQYFGCALVDKLTGSAWLARPDVQKARDAVKSYCAKAAGGEWIESSEYNLGTIKILLLGAYAAGIEDYPEVAKLVPDMADQLAFHITPDFKQAHQWGDNQEARTLHLTHRFPCSAMLAGLTGNPALHDTLGKITAGANLNSYFLLGYRALYFYQPPKQGKYLRTTPGIGLGIYKRDTSLCGVKLSPSVGVDHSTFNHADVQLYLDSEWAVTRPIGYTGNFSVSNAPLFCGLPNMGTRPDAVWEETATGFKVTSQTSGIYYGSGYYNPPPAFVQSFTRTTVYTHPNKLEVTDSFKGSDPRTMPKLDRYATGDLAAIKLAQALWMQVWHAPVQPTETDTGYTWVLKSGKTVTLTVTGWKSRWVLKETDVLTLNYPPKELVGYQMRFGSNDPQATIAATIEVK